MEQYQQTLQEKLTEFKVQGSNLGKIFIKILRNGGITPTEFKKSLKIFWEQDNKLEESDRQIYKMYKNLIDDIRANTSIFDTHEGTEMIEVIYEYFNLDKLKSPRVKYDQKIGTARGGYKPFKGSILLEDSKEKLFEHLINDLFLQGFFSLSDTPIHEFLHYYFHENISLISHENIQIILFISLIILSTINAFKGFNGMGNPLDFSASVFLAIGLYFYGYTLYYKTEQIINESFAYIWSKPIDAIDLKEKAISIKSGYFKRQKNINADSIEDILILMEKLKALDISSTELAGELRNLVDKLTNFSPKALKIKLEDILNKHQSANNVNTAEFEELYALKKAETKRDMVMVKILTLNLMQEIVKKASEFEEG